ncbi:adenosylcobinamide-phosphate synthase CbiB [Shimia aestuarii]|uniref:Cobalamin biosynthesis protein CobD n=1 Tax=Shimia aestuarii TaxID=254406 RepID=A0A1I4JKU4_9RHOB|nr:adenosylcobinamide-phosphate synthase CbiB [Shimia aestuarii]SFL67182.1 adenosylcobinamide-phosphate synthase [Shimia aestuarii]
MSTAALLALALLIDAIFGEPDWVWRRLPHPAVLMGRLIGWAETHLNRGPIRRVNGILLVLTLVGGMWALGRGLSFLGWLPEMVLAAILMAQRSLVDHVRAVGDALRISLGDGRRAVARIVSRDTANMDQSAVTRSAIESAAENLSDGVIAPAFWYLVAGLPGLLVYKIINTADSMIGYRTDRFAAFGWAAARLDDVLNWIPARFTAALIAATHHGFSDWGAIRADARLHRSPNAGWPESAMARALDTAIAGPRAYDGEMRDFPFVNPHGRHDLGPDDIDAACTALWRSWGAFLAIVIGLALI